MLRTIFHFFLFSGLFIALCAVLMVHQTNQLLQLQYTGNALLYFVFFSTLCSYNIHWHLTPFAASEKIRTKWTQQHRAIHIGLAITGVLGATWFLFSFRDKWNWIMPAIFLTFLYTAPNLPYPFLRRLQKIVIGKTIYLSAVWMYVTTMLPVLISGNGFTGRSILFCVSRFFLLFTLCIIFDFRDREQDKKAGVRSLITYFNEKGIDRLFVCCFLVFVLSTTLLLLYNTSILVIIALLLPGILTALLYPRAKNNYSDYLYYFVLDGLLMVSPLLTVFLPI